MIPLQPRIETLKEKKLVGKRMEMSLTNNKTAELWRSFISIKKEIKNAVGTERYSMQRYPPSYFQNFNPQAMFEKWAAVEVTDVETIPLDMEWVLLTGGLYAVFDYKGSSTDTSIFTYIFTRWLPQSGYELDNRPHFEILGDKYKNADPDSEEEIWIPIKPR